MRPDISRRLKRRLAWTTGLVMAGLTSAVAIASENRPTPEIITLFDRVQNEVVSPVKILSTARIEGISDTIGPVSETLTSRLSWLKSEVRKLQEKPGMRDRIPQKLIEAAYASGVEDAVEFSYGEVELDKIVTEIGAMGPDLITAAFDIRGKLVGAGLGEETAEKMALETVQAGARSATDRSDIWITELGSSVDSWKYAWDCQDCGDLQVDAIVTIPFEGLSAVSEKLDDALLYSHNDRLEVSRAFSSMKQEAPMLLAELTPEL